MDGTKTVDFQVETVEETKRLFDAALSELGVTPEELSRQAAQGVFTDDRARLLWMATPNGVVQT